MTPTPLRNIRVDDALWTKALLKAYNDGKNVSEIIRELLAAWTKEA